MWAKHPVKDKTHGRKTLNHPLVGRLNLAYDRMVLADDDDAATYVYTTERLALLASWDVESAPASMPAVD